MTRLTNPLFGLKLQKFRNYCKPEPPKYRVLLPPVLKDHVSKKVKENISAICTHEMSDVFKCLKEHDFGNQNACQKVIQKFQRCVELETMKNKERVKLKKAGKSANPDSGKYHMKEINTMLSRYKQPPVDIKLKK